VRALGAAGLARRTRIVVLMVPTWPEFGFREGVARLRPGTGLAGADGNRRYRAGWADEGEGRYWAAGDGNSGLTESRREKTE